MQEGDIIAQSIAILDILAVLVVVDDGFLVQHASAQDVLILFLRLMVVFRIVIVMIYLFAIFHSKRCYCAVINCESDRDFVDSLIFVGMHPVPSQSYLLPHLQSSLLHE